MVWNFQFLVQFGSLGDANSIGTNKKPSVFITHGLNYRLPHTLNGDVPKPKK